MRKLRFFSSLRTKIALICYALVTVVLVLLNTYVLLASRDIIFSSRISFVEGQATLIAAHIEESFVSLSHEDGERLTAIVSQLEVAGGTAIVITDSEGNVIYDNLGRSRQENFPTHYIETALRGNNVLFSEFVSGTFSSSAFVPVISQGVTIGVVCFNEEDTDQGALLLEMQSTIFNITIAVAVVSVITFTFIFLSIINRLYSVINAVKSVREGEYSYTINMKGNDELALLSDEFNSLTERLRETDEVRRRFVADASHELKTPLATIRLLTDSILQNSDIETDTAMEFISDINQEAERLARTTDKLMTLTRLDSHIENELTAVNLKDAVIETVRMLKSLAETKEVEIKTELSDNCCICATEDSVHHIIFNLVENAIKYNKPGGTVTIGLDTAQNTVLLVVKDTGIGVPEEDLPLIFDRFYRVDKARLHDITAGGSGLGLAIVRDTVRDLGGNVTASTRPEGGMVFTVEFELYDIEV